MQATWTPIELTTPNGASATLLEHGAHIIGWKSAAGHDWIFTSEQAVFAESTPIRGGVPIVFPQFNHFGDGPKHGFLRNLKWQLISPPNTEGDSAHCALEFDSNAQTHGLWPFDFNARLDVTLQDDALTMALTITNTGDHGFAFSGALHTYFAVDALGDTTLTGLTGKPFWDNGTPWEERNVFSSETLALQGAIDRVFFGIDQPITLRDKKGQLRVEQSGFADAVVWNPGAEGASAISDLGDDEYPQMLCVEAAAIEHKITLEPGQSWTGRQLLSEQ